MRIVRWFDNFVGSLVGLLPNWLYRPFEILSVVARPSTWALVLLIVTLVAASKSYNDLFWAGLVGFLLIPLSTVMKLLSRRQRPISVYTETMKIKSYSFPSSHAYAASLGGGFLILLAISTLDGFLTWALVTIIASLVFLVGIARIYLKAHFPSDVLAGAILAAIVLIVIKLIFVI